MGTPPAPREPGPRAEGARARPQGGNEELELLRCFPGSSEFLGLGHVSAVEIRKQMLITV